jgi:multiple antibiotic resistance protein
MSRAAWHLARTAAVFLAVTITCAVAWLLMRSAANAERLLPKTLLRALERIMGLLLAAVAIEFIAGGVRDMLRPP